MDKDSHKESPNLYWPIYKNLEHEVEELSYNVMFCDENLGTFSIKIADLILRAASQIESISKEIFVDYFKLDLVGRKKTRSKLLYDADCITKFIGEWGLDKKEVAISMPAASFSSDKHNYFPFSYSETKKIREIETPIIGWNVAYQNIKHDYKNGLREYATLGNLIEIMGALYLLNIYYVRPRKIATKRPFATIPDFEYADFGSAIFNVVVGYVDINISYRNLAVTTNTKGLNFDHCVGIAKMPDNDVESLQWVMRHLLKKNSIISLLGPEDTERKELEEYRRELISLPQIEIIVNLNQTRIYNAESPKIIKIYRSRAGKTNQ